MRKKFILGFILASVLLMSVIGVNAQITGEAVITGNMVNTGYSCGSDNDCDNAGPYSAASSCGKNKNCACAAAVDGGAKTCFQPSPVAPGGEVTDTRTPSTTSTKTGTIRTQTKAETSGVRQSSVSPGRGWTATIARDGITTCYVKSTAGRTSLFRGRFLGKLFE